MKALIFGAGGQVGRALAATAPADAEVSALTHTQCDVTSPDQVARAIAASAPDVVFNAAAYTAVDRAESEVAMAEALNAAAPGFIAEAARGAGARTVHISTDYVFDGTATRPYRPDDPTTPLFPKQRPMRPIRLIRPRRQRATISSGPITTRSAYRRRSRTARTITGPISFRRS